jgi:hypothetical protein
VLRGGPHAGPLLDNAQLRQSLNHRGFNRPMFRDLAEGEDFFWTKLLAFGRGRRPKVCHTYFPIAGRIGFGLSAFRPVPRPATKA